MREEANKRKHDYQVVSKFSDKLFVSDDICRETGAATSSTFMPDQFANPQTYGQIRIADAPGGIDAGGQGKTNGVRAHLFLGLHPADFLQRPKPRPFPLGHDEHPVFDQNSVVRVERHDIGDGSERHQIEIFAHVGGRAGEQAVQGSHEQKGDAYPGQFPAGPFLQFGIDDDVRLVISAQITDTISVNLQNYIITYRTNKTRKDLAYSKTLYQEAKTAYTEAQNKYAHFTDANQNIFLHSYRAEQERLQNEMNLTYQIYFITSMISTCP